MSSGAWTAIVISITVVIVAIIITAMTIQKKKGKSCCSDCSSCPYCTGDNKKVCSCHQKDSTKPHI